MTEVTDMRAFDGRPLRRASGGFSLLELLMVVTIMGILAAISVAGYSRYVLRANRTEARMALLAVQVAQEKFFLQNNTYATNLVTVTAAPPAGLGVSLDSVGTTPGGHYVVTFTAATATSYTLQAQATGGQTKDDPACQIYSVTDQGVLTPPAGTSCWR